MTTTLVELLELMRRQLHSCTQSAFDWVLMPNNKVGRWRCWSAYMICTLCWREHFMRNVFAAGLKYETPMRKPLTMVATLHLWQKQISSPQIHPPPTATRKADSEGTVSIVFTRQNQLKYVAIWEATFYSFIWLLGAPVPHSIEGQHTCSYWKEGKESPVLVVITNIIQIFIFAHRRHNNVVRTQGTITSTSCTSSCSHYWRNPLVSDYIC